MRKLTAIMVVMVLALSASKSSAEQTLDSEKIIDVEKLKATLNEATTPISSRLKQTRLLQQFKTVNSLLSEEQIPKERLVEELKELKQEMDGFTENFSEITEPLWNAEEKIGETLNKVRLMLARGKGGEPTKRVRALLENYDRRLADLAKVIEQEKDEARKKRLKTVFANVLSLRDLVEKSGSINLGPASEAVYIGIVESLANLESALTSATFSVERTRVVIAGQSEWIDNYCEILEGLIESENLAHVLGQMNAAGEGVAVLNGQMAELNGLCEKFTKMMDRFASNIADYINTQTAQMVDSVPVDHAYIDKKIQEYASRKTMTVNAGKSGK
jgi:hypothetical protein